MVKFYDYNDNLRNMNISEYYSYCHNLSINSISSGDKDLILHVIRKFQRIKISYKNFYLKHNMAIDNEIQSLIRVLPKNIIPLQHYREGGTAESWHLLPGFKGYSSEMMQFWFR